MLIKIALNFHMNNWLSLCIRVYFYYLHKVIRSITKFDLNIKKSSVNNIRSITKYKRKFSQ